MSAVAKLYFSTKGTSPQIPLHRCCQPSKLNQRGLGTGKQRSIWGWFHTSYIRSEKDLPVILYNLNLLGNDRHNYIVTTFRRCGEVELPFSAECNTYHMLLLIPKKGPSIQPAPLQRRHVCVNSSQSLSICISDARFSLNR